MSYQEVLIFAYNDHSESEIFNRKIKILNKTLISRLFLVIEIVANKFSNITSIFLVILGIGMVTLEFFILFLPLIIFVRLLSIFLILLGLLSLYYNEKSKLSIVTLIESLTYAIIGLTSAILTNWLATPELNEAITQYLTNFLKGTMLRKYIAKGIVFLTFREIFLPLSILSFAFFLFGLTLFIDRCMRYRQMLPIIAILNNFVNLSAKNTPKEEFEEFKALLEPFYIAIDLFISSTRSRCVLQIWSSLDGILKIKYRKTFQKEPISKRNKYYSPKEICLLYTSPSPRDLSTSRMPSSA